MQFAFPAGEGGGEGAARGGGILVREVGEQARQEEPAPQEGGEEDADDPAGAGEVDEGAGTGRHGQAPPVREERRVRMLITTFFLRRPGERRVWQNMGATPS
ncbi:MAG: hypothetical protein WC343_11280 [Bacilli bacterium]